MGYFANSTEGDLFIEKYCINCKNWRNGDFGYFCVIMDLHSLYGYELCNSKSIGKKILDSLIENDGNNIDKWKCSMYLKKESDEKCQD